MKQHIYKIFFTLILSGPFWAMAQSDLDPEAEFIYRGRHYIPHSPWWTVGGGYGYNFSEKVGEPNFMLDVHFRIKRKHYFGAGFVTQRERFFYNSDTLFYSHRWNRQSVNSIHALYGYRVEKINRNYGAFIGPSFNWGYDYLHTDENGYDWHEGYIEPGIYASLQYTFKLYYDLGAGLSAFTNLTPSSQVMGLTLHVYFSTAFKREL
jgi:hypothetical protein